MTELAHPAADVVTPSAMVVLQERPVVGLSVWLSDAVRRCAEESLALQLVTPATSRLTYPLELVMGSTDARWVVRSSDGSGYYDGLRGVPLRWDGDGFRALPGSAGGTTAPDYAAPAEVAAGTVRIDATVLHPASDRTELGALVESCTAGLASTGPAGWGVSEPATQRWDRAELTRLCRKRAPASTALVVVGGGADGPALGSLAVERVPSGVRERLRLAVGSTGGPRLELVDQLAERLAHRPGVRSMSAGLRAGRGDCTVEPRHTGDPVPYGLLVGAEGVAERGVDHALAAPAPQVRLVGPASRPACWVRLVGGPGELADPRRVLAGVLLHFDVGRAG